jgi:hypothetical protein
MAMSQWNVRAPQRLDFHSVRALNVHLAAGTVAVIASDEKPSVVISQLTGRPLQVTMDMEEHALTIGYESMSWDGLRGLLNPGRDQVAVTIAVPAECRSRVRVHSASAVVCGLRSGAAVRSLSGDITLDGVTGDVDAETLSGEIAARDIDGAVRLKSLSGGLTLAGGLLSSLTANTMSGPVTADVTLGDSGSAHVSAASGEVTLRLPAESDARVHLQSVSGAVKTEFDSLRTVRAPASHNVSGNVGAGTGHVSVTTMSGSVTLLRRAPVGMESNTR